MLRRADKITEMRVEATDGEIGSVDDVYFDDQSWAVRYFVVDTGPWLFGRRVLISPLAMEETSDAADASGFGSLAQDTVRVNLTKDQVENSPEVDLAKPVSRQYETSLHDYYAWDYYWLAVPTAAYGMSGVSGGAAGAGVGAPVPAATTSAQRDTEAESAEAESENEKDYDPHLRSMNEVVGYNIGATDGEIGHVEDFFIDDQAWVIRYLLVDTRNWLPGRKVLISPEWIDSVSWNERIVSVEVTKQQVEDSPEYNPEPNGFLDRDYEANLFRHYGLPFYWF